MKLDGELAAIERDGERASSAAAAPGCPRPRRKAADWGLSGPRVRDQHPRHRRRRGADERQRLRRPAGARCSSGSRSATADRAPSAAPRRSSASPTAARTSRAGEVVARASFALSPGRPGGDQGDAGVDARPPARGAALGDQDLRLDLQEPRRRARRGPLRRAAARGGRLPRPASVGGARFSEKHANFVENTGEATTADVLALMAEGRRRVHERFGVELEPEVQVLGEVELAGGLGSCEADRRSSPSPWSCRRRWRSTGSPCAIPRHTTASGRAGADAGRPRSAKASGVIVVARRRRGRLAGSATRRKKDRQLPVLPLTRRGRKATRSRRARCSNRCEVLGAAPKALRRYVAEQSLRQERGGRRIHLGDRNALRRRLRAGEEVESGGGGPCRSVGDGAQLCRRARAAAAIRRAAVSSGLPSFRRARILRRNAG